MPLMAAITAAAGNKGGGGALTGRAVMLFNCKFCLKRHYALRLLGMASASLSSMLPVLQVANAETLHVCPADVLLLSALGWAPSNRWRLT